MKNIFDRNFKRDIKNNEIYVISNKEFIKFCGLSI